MIQAWGEGESSDQEVMQWFTKDGLRAVCSWLSCVEHDDGCIFASGIDEDI